MKVIVRRKDPAEIHIHGEETRIEASGRVDGAGFPVLSINVWNDDDKGIFEFIGSSEDKEPLVLTIADISRLLGFELATVMYTHGEVTDRTSNVRLLKK